MFNWLGQILMSLKYTCKCLKSQTVNKIILKKRGKILGIIVWDFWKQKKIA